MVNPYNDNSSKKNEVRAMFNSIARSYDFLNHFLSFGIDILWRKRVLKLLKKEQPKLVLDMATGTGDLAIMASKKLGCSVIGVDLSSEMVGVGIEKVEKRNLGESVKLEVGDAEKIDYPDNYFDAGMVAFGVRNFENLELGLQEISRVLKKDSPFYILEFSKPVKFPMKQLYWFYSFKLLPIIGRIVSKDPRAYMYLPESIKAFPSGDEFIDILARCNFSKCYQVPLSGRIATIYVGYKS